MQSKEKVKEQLSELLAKKRNGELDIEEKISNPTDRALWRDSVSFDDLLFYMCCFDDEIKLNTLLLLVESKKSTLMLSKEELSLIKRFLICNVNERLEYVPLIKKALKRIKDSSGVMHRQLVQEKKKEELKLEKTKSLSTVESNLTSYNEFLTWLHEFSICNPDAAYHHRRSSLQILLLMRDIMGDEFECNKWTVDEAEKIFKLLLLDMYEVNKDMAFDLLKSIDIRLLQLDKEDRVWDIIRVAIELGNGIRPMDSVTASYMLKVGMLSPIIQQVLNAQFDWEECYLNVTEAVTLQLVLILFRKLKESLTMAKENIVLTVTKHSLYGYLYCLRSLLSNCNLSDAGKENAWKHTMAELITVCFELNNAVSVIVNNSSPEGHLPMDLNLQAINEICDSTPEKEVVTPQMVLLCSWRTVKEVSLLFGLLAIKSPISEHGSSQGCLNEEQIIKIGEHLVTLLTETKHRGAFEQAHVGFNQLCTRLWRLNDKSLSQLPKVWLHQILMAVTGFAEGNTKLCATRRSAGVPFMVQALISSEPRPYKDTQTLTFGSVMKILLGFAEFDSTANLWEKVKHLMYKDTVFSEYENLFVSLKSNVNDNCIEGNEAQITEIKTHALNILRAIFRHSQLGEIVTNYAADGLIVAFKSYDGKSWAERNAATLLFSALIVRIFGVQRTKDHVNLTTENKMNCKVFFEKYPSLLPFILQELETFVSINDNVTKSNVQSILLLLSRLYLTQSTEGTSIHSKVNEITYLISQCAKSSVYETRKLAARALVPLLTETSVAHVTQQIVNSIISAEKTPLVLNLIHGYMLQILEIMKHFNAIELQLCNIDWNVFLEKTNWILENLECNNSKPACFALGTVYINICHEMYKQGYKTTSHLLAKMYMFVPHLVERRKLKQGPAREDYKTSAIKFMLSVLKSNDPKICNFLNLLNVPLRVYLHILNVPEIQNIAWSTFAEVINQITDNNTKSLINNYGLDIIRNSMDNLHKFNPDLQDAIFDFLYDNLSRENKYPDSDTWSIECTELQTNKLSVFVLSEIRDNKCKSSYCQRDSYLRLLGKSYVTLDDCCDEYMDDVYNNFCDSSWIASLRDPAFRASVFNILSALVPNFYDIDKFHYVQIKWWTTVLQLLVDNNPDVRNDAAKVVRDTTEVIDVVLDTETLLHQFFSGFHDFMCYGKNEFACVVFFYWSVSLLDDTDYEMDETDVFNKCQNYDFFEPIKISKQCCEFLHARFESSMDNTLPDDAIDWLNSHLNIDLPKSISFKTLVKSYKSYLPSLENNLADILDPVYKNKLLQILSYKEYESLLLPIEDPVPK